MIDAPDTRKFKHNHSSYTRLHRSNPTSLNLDSDTTYTANSMHTWLKTSEKAYVTDVQPLCPI